ncbi:hypothetical protein TYRP_012363, partial [Tyrophagus putrescentiae]
MDKLENGVPFLGSCKIENFIGHPERNYTVSYYRTSVGFAKNLIGWHELSAPSDEFPSQRHIFNFVQQTNMIVHSGSHFSYPLFDVVVSPTGVIKRENYWCEVDVQINGGSTDNIPSKIWVNTPILELTISSLGGNYHQARCHILFYNPDRSNRTYAVQLFISNSLMASFNVRPNQSEEFVPEVVYTYQKNFRHGVHYTLPTFDFVYYSDITISSSFNCKLVDGTSGQADYEVFTSNEYNHYMLINTILKMLGAKNTTVSFLTIATTCLVLLFFVATKTVVTATFAAVPDNVAAKTITVNFTTNLTKVERGKPFLLSCHIDNFTDHATRNYSVAFYRVHRINEVILIATHELTVFPNANHSFKNQHQHHLFKVEQSKEVISVLSSGASPHQHASYPLFEAVITLLKQSVAERFRRSTLMPEEREFESLCLAARPPPRGSQDPPSRRTTTDFKRGFFEAVITPGTGFPERQDYWCQLQVQMLGTANHQYRHRFSISSQMWGNIPLLALTLEKMSLEKGEEGQDLNNNTYRATCLVDTASRRSPAASTRPTTTTSSVLRPTLKVPEVTFKANVTKPVSSVPFLITCHIENFDREGEHNYTVNYYKTAVAGNRTLIGRHEVTAYDSKNRPLHLFINVPQQNAEVHQGPRYQYPAFDAVVSVADVSYLEDYWCELNITSTQVVLSARKVATSTPWPGFPLVSLSIVDVESAPNTYLARCTVSVFSNAERRPYTVQLLVSNIVMGTFRQSKPTEEVEFTLSAPYYEHLKVIGHGNCRITIE